MIKRSNIDARSTDGLLFPQEMFGTDGRSPRPILNRVQYIYDLRKHQTVYGIGSVAELLGYCATDIHEMGPHGLAKLIHPDDVEAVSAHYQQFYQLQYGEVIAIQYRMKRMDRSWCCLSSQETLLMPEAIGQAPSQVLGMIEDVTQPPVNRLRLLQHFFRRRAATSKCSYPAEETSSHSEDATKP